MHSKSVEEGGRAYNWDKINKYYFVQVIEPGTLFNKHPPYSKIYKKKKLKKQKRGDRSNTKKLLWQNHKCDRFDYNSIIKTEKQNVILYSLPDSHLE